jgi:hypothetical protein
VLASDRVEELGGDKRAAGLEAGLNKLAEDGWELVAIEPGHVPPPVQRPKYVLKRPR